MSAKKKSSNEYSDPARNMGHKAESERGSRQPLWTTAVKEKILSPQGHKSSKFQDNCGVANPSAKPHAEHQHKGSRQHTDDKHVIKLQPSVTGQKQQLMSKSNKDDELVKYMSNLPNYLQQVEKQKSIQVKALNFGVLDWKRLEKWNHSEHLPERGQPKESSSGSSLSMGTGKSTSSKTSVGRKQSSTDLHLKSPIEVRVCEDARQLQGKVKSIQDPQTVSQSNIAGQKKDFSQSVKSSSRRYPRAIHDEGKKKEPDQIERTFSTSSLPRGKQHGKSRTLDGINHSPKSCNAEPQNIVLLKPKCPSKRSSTRFSRLSASSDGKLMRDSRDGDCALSSSQELQSRDLSHEFPHSRPLPPRVAVAQEKVLDVCNFPHQSDKSIEPLSSEAKCPNANIMDVHHPVSADSSKGMSTDTAQKTESRASSQQHFADGNRNRYSDCFSSQDIHCREIHSEILHSCPLPTSIAISQSRGSDFCPYSTQNETTTEPRLSNATCPESKSGNLDDSVSIESFKEMDLAFAKQTAPRGRHPSPNRRFSFSLGRLSRSFSFKESSTFTHSSSTHSTAESGPGKHEVSAPIDDGKRDKANASGRRRPSPFRKLLDPLLKPKVAHSTEAVQTKGAQSTEKNSTFVTLQPNNVDKPLFNETNPASTFEALMQLTVKNGIPFYKFVVDNRSDILAAALKQLPSSGQVDHTLTYSFYSVHEIKKKGGGWITNGSKEKSCGIGYNMVGQMKLTRSLLSGLYAEDCNEQSVVTESILYDVTEGDKGSTDVVPDREIAAIILNDPIAKRNNGESKADNACYQGEKENCNSTTVILPGAFHSLPSKGAPSSLIHRWKSGGLCDCGGWDVGCKLKILADCNQGSSFSTSAMTRSSPECMHLFIQGGDGKSPPMFSLAPVKDGFYSVEFDSSISLLEGFAICVAVITSREFADVFDIKRQAELPVQVKAENDEKNEMKLQREVPAKFVSSPPSSPVGRI